MPEKEQNELYETKMQGDWNTLNLLEISLEKRILRIPRKNGR